MSGTISIGTATGGATPTTTTITGSAATCSFSGTVTFTPPLTASGGGSGSSIEAGLSDCTSNSGIVESFGSPQLDGTFASSPFTCSASSATQPALSAVVSWNDGTAWPSGGIASTQVDGSIATGSFAGTAVVDLQVPSDIATGCADGAVSTDAVSGTITVGPACGQVGDPLSVYPIVPPVCGAQNYQPTSMTRGSDGALWFTTYDDKLIGRTTTAGVTTFYPVPSAWDGTEGNGGITSGSDGALWFLANSGQAIGRITTSGSVSTFPLASSAGYAAAITSGPDGALWFTANNNNGSNAIGRITTSGQLTMFTDSLLGTANWDTSAHRDLVDITSGPDGSLWFSMIDSTSLSTANAWIGKITTSGVVTDHAIPFNIDVDPLTAGPDGTIWFAGADPFSANVIGRMTTSGVFSEYAGQPGQIGQVLAMTAGPDGALWYTNYSVPGDYEFHPYPSIGRITTKGAITTYGNALIEVGAMDITTGPDGAMWFNDRINDSIGRVSVP